MTTGLFSERLWRRVNDHFRDSGQLYVEAPRPRSYRRKVERMYDEFPTERPLPQQAAFLVKNLVNLQRYPDANKRTAAVLLEVFLQTHGYKLTCRDEAYVEFLLRVQRAVPTAAWDGRTFTLQPDYIAWQDDAYHRELAAWIEANTKKKN